MKTTIKLLSVMGILSALACTPGKVTEKTTNLSGGTTAPSGGPVIGNIVLGNPILVPVVINPTPAPTATPLPTIAPHPTVGPQINQSSMNMKHNKISLMLAGLSFLMSDAHAATRVVSAAAPSLEPALVPNFQAAAVVPNLNANIIANTQIEIFNYATLSAALANALNPSDLQKYQTEYTNYLASLPQVISTVTTAAADSARLRAALPTDLKQLVGLTLNASSGTINLQATLADLLNPNAAVIAFNGQAYIGNELIAGKRISELQSPGLVKTDGFNISLVGGKVGNSINANIANINFNNSDHTFALATVASTLPINANRVGTALYGINANIASAAGFASSYAGNFALLADLNSAGQISQLYSYNLTSGIISAKLASGATIFSNCSAITTALGKGTCAPSRVGPATSFTEVSTSTTLNTNLTAGPALNANTAVLPIAEGTYNVVDTATVSAKINTNVTSKIAPLAAPKSE